jgi:hypothetical protein
LLAAELNRDTAWQERELAAFQAIAAGFTVHQLPSTT